MRSAVPVVMNAVESGIMPATSTTVVHETLRYACVGVTTRKSTSAHAASSDAIHSRADRR